MIVTMLSYASILNAVVRLVSVLFASSLICISRSSPALSIVFEYLSLAVILYLYEVPAIKVVGANANAHSGPYALAGITVNENGLPLMCAELSNTYMVYVPMAVIFLVKLYIPVLAFTIVKDDDALFESYRMALNVGDALSSQIFPY